MPPRETSRFCRRGPWVGPSRRTPRGRSTMPDTDQRDAEEMKAEHTSEAQQKAHEAKEAHDRAEETMKKLEESDEPPKDLEDWPDDEAKYVTYGGGEGDHGYEDGPERKLGPSSLERHADGSVSIGGGKVDDPERDKNGP